ncbi:hypothetical protein FQR65_LT10128 [Abscondita terminalis]|nr:hypothetical protein FQR65_LT10128 [Abscondita terminalis]
MNLLWFVYVILFTSATVQNCKTPSGLNGECVLLAQCQSLLWQFSNPKYGMINYLDQFECVNNYDNGIFVCCPAPIDVLVFENEKDHYDLNSIYNLKELTNVHGCGIQTSPLQNNGVVHLKDYPWLVKIVWRIKSNSLKNISCTGVIITSRYILYSAECHSSEVNLYEYFYVRIDYSTGNESNCDVPFLSYTTGCSTSETFEVEDFIVHPFYDPVTKINNIALMRLSRRIENAIPICLPLVTETFDHGVMVTSGWNQTLHGVSDVSVKTSKISTSITNSACKHLVLNDHILTTFDMCTVNETATDEQSIGYPVMSFYQNQWYIVEHCLTPSNDTGECIQLTECPRLLTAFANVDPKDQAYLEDFLCSYPDDPVGTMRVCCGNMPNFTIATSLIDAEPSPYNISDIRFCGLQHRDDYLSLDKTLSVDEFPWLAAIVNGTSATERDALCGGSLITNRYVLTSAQCTFTFNPEDIMLVRLEDYNLKTKVDCLLVPELNDFECNDVQEHKVEDIKYHPFYNKYQYLNDIALLRLEVKVVFSDYVRPICLPTSEDDVTNFGKTFYMTGFGENERDGKRPKIKKKIYTSLISLNVCHDKGKPYYFANPVTEYQICTDLFENSTDVTCIGDEGGPVMYKKKFQWFIEGISSTFGCRNGEPLTHLKVFKYLKWITLNIKP